MGLCPDCGRPASECGSEQYMVQTRVCGPSAAVDQWRKDNKNPPPGVVLSTVKVKAAVDSPAVQTAPEWWLRKHGYIE
ncbi:hypothetical protein ABDK96_02100 [Citricoccus nitrophenolicus]|uniref:Uncharacterized protein n=1 Tax=Citricoccus nitrophenolicus TaxID=863575 RepID=A0ABV0IEG3_9MICC